jgi:hypothetical protein
LTLLDQIFISQIHFLSFQQLSLKSQAMTFFSRAAVASLLVASVPQSTEASFSYDLTSAIGPDFWGDLAIEGNQ